MIALLVLILVTVTACEREKDADTGPGSAKGDIPIRHISCDGVGIECIVTARFDSLDSCESHDRWANMLCDSHSSPSEMVCTILPEWERRLVTTYCTK